MSGTRCTLSLQNHDAREVADAMGIDREFKATRNLKKRRLFEYESEDTSTMTTPETIFCQNYFFPLLMQHSPASVNVSPSWKVSIIFLDFFILRQI